MDSAAIDPTSFTALLVFCAVVTLFALLSIATTILLLRKNSSLVELLHVESRRHTNEILALSERLNGQYYIHQEKVSIEHTATLRQLLESFSIAASGKPPD